MQNYETYSRPKTLFIHLEAGEGSHIHLCCHICVFLMTNLEGFTSSNLSITFLRDKFCSKPSKDFWNNIIMREKKTHNSFLIWDCIFICCHCNNPSFINVKTSFKMRKCQIAVTWLAILVSHFFHIHIKLYKDLTIKKV